MRLQVVWLGFDKRFQMQSHSLMGDFLTPDQIEILQEAHRASKELKASTSESFLNSTKFHFGNGIH